MDFREAQIPVFGFNYSVVERLYPKSVTECHQISVA